MAEVTRKSDVPEGRTEASMINEAVGVFVLNSKEPLSESGTRANYISGFLRDMDAGDRIELHVRMGEGCTWVNLKGTLESRFFSDETYELPHEREQRSPEGILFRENGQGEPSLVRYENIAHYSRAD